jgi:hypothetical protein
METPEPIKLRDEARERVDAARHIIVRCSKCRGLMARGSVVLPSDGLSAGVHLVGTTFGGGNKWENTDGFLSDEHPEPVRLFCHKHNVAVDEDGEQLITTGTVTLDAIKPFIAKWMRTGKRQEVMIEPGEPGKHFRADFRQPSPGER